MNIILRIVLNLNAIDSAGFVDLVNSNLGSVLYGSSVKSSCSGKRSDTSDVESSLTG